MIEPLEPFELDLEKITLIEASAGTGKTYTITTLFARLIGQGYPLESILVVTFTEAAASELKLRIRKRLSACLMAGRAGGNAGKTDDFDELARFFKSQVDSDLVFQRISLALTCFDQACITTIHSFCYQTLRDNAFESGSYFDIELLSDNSGFFRQVSMDFFMTRVNNQDPLYINFLAGKAMTPERFRSSFSRVISRPQIDTIPDAKTDTGIFPIDIKSLCDNYRELTQKLRCLEGERDAIIDLIQSHKGVDKRSYSKKNLPKWLDTAFDDLICRGKNALFNMTEKGDSLYKFTSSRLELKTKSGTAPDHAFFSLCQDLFALSVKMESSLISLKLDFLDFFHRELAKMKQELGVCFFDDLVNDLASALAAGGSKAVLKKAVREKYKACLIDEFQDTDPVQYGIFSTLFSRAGDEKQVPFFMIGDPKQAIYGFRGGDIFAYLAACKESDQVFTLEKNYRSAPLLVEGVNDIFGLAKNPFRYEEIKFSRVSTPDTAVDRLADFQGKLLSPLQFAFIPREGFPTGPDQTVKKEAALSVIPKILARDILFWLTSDTRLLTGNTQLSSSESKNRTGRPVTPGDMAVLVRTNSQAGQVQKALARLNIPSFLSATGSVFDSREAVEFHDILMAVYEPDNPGYLKAALSSSVFGFSAGKLSGLSKDDDQLQLWQDKFHLAKDIWEEKGVVSMITFLFHCDQGLGRAESCVMERGLTNFYHLIELVSNSALTKSLSMFYLIKWYRDQLFSETREEGADELRLESDKKAVAIVTIHKSKGLEYPLVFLPYLWTGSQGGKDRDAVLFHDPDLDNRLCVDLGSSDIQRALDLKAEEDRAEEMRLLYVALTRASAMCRIFWGGFAGVDLSALGSLIHPESVGTDEGMLNDLDSLLSGAQVDPGATMVESFDKGFSGGEAKDSYVPDDIVGEELSPRKSAGKIFSDWRISSFSAIASSAHGKGVKEAGPESATGEQEQENPISLKDFPKGPGSGDFFHAVLEELDFAKAHGKTLADCVKDNLAGHGFREQGLEAMAIEGLSDVLATPLVPEHNFGSWPGNGIESIAEELEGVKKSPGFCLKDIGLSQRLTELEFIFDVDGFNHQALVSLFRELSQGYSELLACLDPGTFKGFVKGFIDLVVCCQDKWYILDYKSNFLGSAYRDYNQKTMAEAMEKHHYILQYHIYLAALHRYLTLRLKDYDYEKNFGGVFYLFIRGMKPGGDGTGVYFHRPSAGFINRFMAVFSSENDKIEDGHGPSMV